MAKQLEGIVVSNKMKDTVVVKIERFVKHPRYKKIMRRVSKLNAHTESALNVGDKVTIEETSPISRTVNFKVLGEVKKEEERVTVTKVKKSKK